MGETEKGARCGTMSIDKKKEIIDFISKNPQLKAGGKFTQDFTAKTSQSLWKTLATNLNSVPGAKKDWKKWRKVRVFNL